MKPGYKTTEFWITIVLTFVGAMMASGGIPEDVIWGKLAGALLAAGSAAGYSVSRGLAKKAGG